MKTDTAPVFAYRDAFDAAIDAAAKTVCESLGVSDPALAEAYWQGSDGTAIRACLMRFAAHMLIHEAARFE
jgi:hypothetical protein